MYENKLVIMVILYWATFIASYYLGRRLGKIRNRAYFDKWFRIGVFEEKERVESKKEL